MRIAPTSAVPSEIPRFENVFWRPPTSPLCSSGSADTVTAPSCDASAPMPRPARSIGQSGDLGARALRRARRRTPTRPRNSMRNPKRVDEPGRRLREQLGDADRGDHQRDRQRQDAQPGVDGREPERDREEQRHREEEAGLQQVLEEEGAEPAAQQPDPEDRGIEQRGQAGVAPVLLPLEEAEQHDAPAEEQPDHRREPEPRGRVGLGLHEAPRPRAQHAVDDQAETEGRERGADEVEPGALFLRRVGGAAVEQEDHADDQDLADEHVAPRPVGGEQPADQRAERDRDRATRSDDAVGAWPLGLHEVRRHQRHDRGHHQRRARRPSRNDHPNSSTGRFGDSAVVNEPHA